MRKRSKVGDVDRSCGLKYSILRCLIVITPQPVFVYGSATMALCFMCLLLRGLPEIPSHVLVSKVSPMNLVLQRRSISRKKLHSIDFQSQVFEVIFQIYSITH